MPRESGKPKWVVNVRSERKSAKGKWKVKMENKKVESFKCKVDSESGNLNYKGKVEREGGKRKWKVKVESSTTMVFLCTRSMRDFTITLYRDHKVEKTGDYELCFNNYFSVMEEKKVILTLSCYLKMTILMILMTMTVTKWCSLLIMMTSDYD